MRLIALAGTAVVAGLMLACAPARPASAAELRSRAAFELGCPAASLELVRIDESTGGVMGCGRRVVYIERCDDRCRWSFDREAPAPTWGGWATAAPVAGAPPRQHPFVTTTVRTAPEPESEWRERVPPLLDDEPGF